MDKDTDLDGNTKSNSSRRTAAQTAVLMAILILFSKFLGFIREMIMANYFGTTYVTDAYVMSFSILSIIFGGIISAIGTAYTPIYSRVTESMGKESSDRFTSNIMNYLFIITSIISLIGIVFSDQIISFLASGFHGETANLASFFIKVLLFYVVFSSTAAILESYLQYNGVFLSQIVSGYLINICTIIAIIISARTSNYYLGFGILIGYMLRFIVMIYISKLRGYHYSLALQPDDNTKTIITLAIPSFIGSYMLYINMFVDRTIASRLAEGSVSALNYASLLNNMIMGLSISILSTIIYPKLIQANSLKKFNTFNDIINTGLTLVFIISLPCSLGAMLYSQQIVQIVYERGVFNSAATIATSSAFFFYSAGLLFMSINDMLTRVYYSMQDMKTPMIFAAISIIINIALAIVLGYFLQIVGLALATCIASICSTFLLFFGIKSKYPHVELIRSKLKIFKILVSSVISIGLSYLVYHFIVVTSENIITRIIHLFIPAIFAVTIYLLLLIALKVEEVKLLKQVIKKSK